MTSFDLLVDPLGNLSLSNNFFLPDITKKVCEKLYHQPVVLAEGLVPEFTDFKHKCVIFKVQMKFYPLTAGRIIFLNSVAHIYYINIKVYGVFCNLF